LTSLPYNFGSELTHISQLDLSSNKLKELPETFHKLKNLVHLDLYSNQLKDLPPSLVHLKKLRFLDISKNPINPRLKAVVGSCSSRTECESAAKNLLAHLNQQKESALKANQLKEQALKAKKMAQKNKAEEQRKETPVKQTKPEKKQDKKVNNKSTKHNQQQKSNKPTQNGGIKAPKKPQTPKKKSGWCSFTTLMLLIALGLGAYCLHVHCHGDYSRAGLEAALPRLKTSFHLVVNNTRTALRPENLGSTARTVLHHANATQHLVRSTIRKGAYDLQDRLVPYTGDLTPYTSKVSAASDQACAWICGKFAIVYAFLAKQDWQRLIDFLSHYLGIAYVFVRDALIAVWTHPGVQAAVAKIQEVLLIAVQAVWAYILHAAAYLSENTPVWIEIASENCKNIYSSLQNRIQSMLK